MHRSSFVRSVACRFLYRKVCCGIVGNHAAIAGESTGISRVVAGRQFQGSSVASLWDLVCPETMRLRTSANHAIGSTPFSFAVWISVIAIAQ